MLASGRRAVPEKAHMPATTARHILEIPGEVEAVRESARAGASKDQLERLLSRTENTIQGILLLEKPTPWHLQISSK